MSDGWSIFRLNPLGRGRHASLNDEHAKGREQKAAEQAKQRPPTYADLTKAHVQAREASQQREEAERQRAQTVRQLGPNASSMTAERFGKAADAPAQPAMRAAPPAHELRQPHAQGRSASQPTPGGTVSSPYQPYRQGVQSAQEQNPGRSGWQMQSIRGLSEPIASNSRFTKNLPEEGKARAAAGVSQGRDKELDR